MMQMDSPDAQYELTSMGFIWYNYEKIYISPLPSDSLPPSKPNKVWQVLLGDLVPPFCEVNINLTSVAFEFQMNVFKCDILHLLPDYFEERPSEGLGGNFGHK